ncbi:hypothetical protein L1887_23826 [Cichorium endivia]|nr:hypothetical protein L1887_23826 [Cichorium endivia]
MTHRICGHLSYLEAPAKVKFESFNTNILSPEEESDSMLVRVKSKAGCVDSRPMLKPVHPMRVQSYICRRSNPKMKLFLQRAESYHHLLPLPV